MGGELPDASAGADEASTSEGRDADAADAGSDAGPSLPEKAPWDWVGVIGTGQSLSVGSQAAVVVSKEPSRDGKVLRDDGPNPRYPIEGGKPEWALVPLVEPIRPTSPGTGAGYDDAQYPNNVVGETPHAGMANELSALFEARTELPYVSIHSAVGWRGRALDQIDKAGGMRAYKASMSEARVIQAMAKDAGKTFGYGAVVLTHGEADANNTKYGAGIEQLLADYDKDLKAITGQTQDVKLLASQQSARGSGKATSSIQVWLAGQRNPNIVCTGPKYQYGYADDNLHMPAPGYRRLGEKYAEVFDRVVNQRMPWKPVGPKAAVRTGTTIVVTFDVPNPPLTWDTTLAANHQTANKAWAKGRGFEVFDGTTAMTIASVEITAPDQVTLTVTAAPKGAVTVAYAMTPDVDEARSGGLVTGLRGQLRDSDDLVGYDEETLSATVAKGSSTVRLTKGTLASRAVRDVVTGAGAPADWTIVRIAADAKSMTLSTPWPGESGEVTLKVHHDLHNYAVHSYIAVP